jgi:uncharacterized oligopeptide transporter (OPT) family protein
MAQVVNGGSLPPSLLEVAIPLMVLSCCCTLALSLGEHRPELKKWLPFIPNPLPLAIGMYVAPNFTIPRFLGGLGGYIWAKKWKTSHHRFLLVVASGLLLGEGVMSIFLALMKSVGVPQIAS